MTEFFTLLKWPIIKWPRMKSQARTFIVYIKFYERFYIHFNWIWCRISNRIFIRRIQRSGVEDEIKLRRLGYAV